MASKSLIEVGISMVLQDGFSRQAGIISDSYQSLMGNMGVWNRAATQSMGVAVDYTTKMVEGMYGLYKHSADIYNEVFLTSKISGATAAQSEKLMDYIQELNSITPLTNMDIASGAKYMAMAGNDTQQIMDMLGPASKLASIFSMQLGGKGGVADLMTNIMKTFGISSNEAMDIADILGVATTSANMNLTDLAQALTYSGSVFRNSGYDLATAASAIGVLGNQGIQGSSAGTAMANMLRYLTLSITGQKTKGTSYLSALGIGKEDLVDAQGSLKDLGSVMAVLYSRMSKLDRVHLEEASYNIFGVRGERAIQALLNGMKEYATIQNKIANGKGFVETTTQERLNTPAGQIDMFISAIDNLKTAFGQALSMFTPLLKGLTWMINGIAKLAKTGLGGFIVKLAGAVTLAAAINFRLQLMGKVFKLVTSMGSTFNAESQSAASGFGRMVTNAMALEAHMRTIVALMTELVGLQYTSGTRGMMMPYGGRLGRNKNGRPYVRVGRSNFGPGAYAMGLAAASGAGAAAERQAVRTAGAAVTNQVAKKGILGGLARLGGGAFSFLGGWPGMIIMALTTLIPLVLDLIGSNDANTEAVRENTVSGAEAMSLWQQRYLDAVVKAVNTSGKNAKELNIHVNGVAVDPDAGSVDLDLYNLSTY